MRGASNMGGGGGIKNEFRKSGNELDGVANSLSNYIDVSKDEC